MHRQSQIKGILLSIVCTIIMSRIISEIFKLPISGIQKVTWIHPTHNETYAIFGLEYRGLKRTTFVHVDKQGTELYRNSEDFGSTDHFEMLNDKEIIFLNSRNSVIVYFEI